MWLVMPIEHWLRRLYIGPFGKAFSPPFIILGDGVVLGQVECNSFVVSSCEMLSGSRRLPNVLNINLPLVCVFFSCWQWAGHTPFPFALHNVMVKWIDFCARYVGILIEIEFCAEDWTWVKAGVPSGNTVVDDKLISFQFADGWKKMLIALNIPVVIEI